MTMFSIPSMRYEHFEAVVLNNIMMSANVWEYAHIHTDALMT